MTDLSAALADLAAGLDWPAPSDEVSRAAISRIRSASAPSPRRRWVMRIAAAAVAATLVAGPAVADRLGVDGVRIRFGGEVPADLGERLDLGKPITVDELGEVSLPPGLGDPAAAYAGRPAGAVTVVWAPSEELPEVRDTGVGLLLTSFPGRLEIDLVEKRVMAGTRVEHVSVDGAPAWWVSAPHAFLYLDATGTPLEDTIRLSGNALLWTDDGITYRLESSLSLGASIDVAESIT